jgi:hypothetical protein
MQWHAGGSINAEERAEEAEGADLETDPMKMHLLLTKNQFKVRQEQHE